MATTARRKMSVIRKVAAPTLLLLTFALILQSSLFIVTFVFQADARDLAESLESGLRPDVDYLSRFVAQNELGRGSNDCGDVITRARLTITLSALDVASQGNDSALVKVAAIKAFESAAQRLKCNPLDGNAWLRYAATKDRLSGPSPAAIEALRLSYWSAPSESWVIEARLPFATRLYLAGVLGFETEYLEDLRRFTTYETTSQVAETYFDTAPRIREVIRPLIAAQSETRKKAIVAEIDRLGMLFDAP